MEDPERNFPSRRLLGTDAGRCRDAKAERAPAEPDASRFWGWSWVKTVALRHHRFPAAQIYEALRPELPFGPGFRDRGLTDQFDAAISRVEYRGLAVDQGSQRIRRVEWR